MNNREGRRDRPVLTRRFDIAGNSLLRICRHQARARFVPMGNYRGGAGFRCMLVFAVLHYVGRPAFRILIRFERQLSALYRLRERLGSRGAGGDGEAGEQ